MAIATLEECFDNPRVFTGVVKIRKGLAARLLIDSRSLDGVHWWFHSLATRLAARCPMEDPSRDKIMAAAETIIKLTKTRASKAEWRALATRGTVFLAMIAVGASWVASLSS